MTVYYPPSSPRNPEYRTTHKTVFHGLVIWDGTRFHVHVLEQVVGVVPAWCRVLGVPGRRGHQGRRLFFLQKHAHLAGWG